MPEHRELSAVVRNPEGIVFDLDGVLCDTEPLWLEARDEVADEVGGRIVQDDYLRFYGANTAQWSVAMAEILNHPDPAWIGERTIDALLSRYRAGRVRPIVAGVAAVRRAAARGPIAIASGSPPQAIATLLEILGLNDVVATYVSCDEVPAGKPAPDVYLEACRRIGITPARSLAIDRIRFDEKHFRFALNEDAMATEKLAEGIRSFAKDLRALRAMVAAQLG